MNNYKILGTIGLNEWEDCEFVEIDEEVNGKFDTAKEAWESFCKQQEDVGIYSVMCFELVSQSQDFGATGISLKQRGTDCTLDIESIN